VQLLVNADLSTFHALNHYFHIFSFDLTVTYSSIMISEKNQPLVRLTE